MEKALYLEIKTLTENLIKTMEKKGWSFYDRDNIVSEIIFQVMVKDDKKVFRSFQGRSKLSTYLWSAVRNRIINARRKEKYYHFQTDIDEINETLISSNPNQQSNIEALIEDFIENEPPFEKFVKYARWIQELSYQEIIGKTKKVFGDKYSVNTQRIAYILHTNRKKIQKKLKKLDV